MKEGEIEKQVIKHVEHFIDDEINYLDNVLGNADELEKMRSDRLKQMIKRKEDAQRYRAIGHGEYKELVDEREFFTVGQEEERLVIHFYKSDSMRCKILDMHLKQLAEKHLETRICSLNVERFVPLCEKLSCRVIPTIFCFKKGVVAKRIVGFDAFGGTDDFPTTAVEEYLINIGMLDVLE